MSNHRAVDPAGTSRWTERDDVPRGAEYQARFDALAASGAAVHGEADLVETLAPPGGRILDAGCGTGRVAIELARRGFRVTGTDLDPAMLAEAQRRAPDLPWLLADLTDLEHGAPELAEPFDVTVLAGNVLIFVAPGTESAAVAGAAATLGPGGLLVAGFSVTEGGYGPEQLDAHAGDAGLHLVDRWSTWDGAPEARALDYQVSVHRLGD